MVGDTAQWRWPRVRGVLVGALLALVAAVVVTAGAQVYADLEGAPFADLSRDAAAVLDGPNYTGAYAMFTVLVWASSAAVALFCALVMRRSGDRSAARYLLFGGLITAFMVLDDAFLLHETVGLILGDREEVFFVAYGLATVAFAWLHRRRLGPGLLLLAGAFGCWLTSTALDIVLSTGAPFIVEDGLKLAGVVLWAYLMVRISMIEVRRLIRPVAPDAAAGHAAEAAVAEPVTARHARPPTGAHSAPGAGPGSHPPPGAPSRPGTRPPPGVRPPPMPQHLPPQPVGRHTPGPPGLQHSGAHPHDAQRPRPPMGPPPPTGPRPGRPPAPVTTRPPGDDATRPVPTHRPAAHPPAHPPATRPPAHPPATHPPATHPPATQSPDTRSPAVPDDATRPVGVVPPRRPHEDDARAAGPPREHDRSRQ